jgi:hypothetical protein
MWLNIVILLICIFFTLRALVITVGWWKEPILGKFRSYGAEAISYPVVQFAAWLYATVIVFVLMLYPRRTPGVVMFASLILLFIILWVRNYPETAKGLLDRLPIYPIWHRKLREYTSRYERRRIGYLWLRLPQHLRALLNRHDEIFLQWADFVVMGSVMEEDFVAEHFESSLLEQQLYEYER